MSPDNFQESLNDLLNRKPFQLFRIELHNGQHYEIDHPTTIGVRNSMAVYLPPGGGVKIFDNESVLQFVIDQPTSL